MIKKNTKLIQFSDYWWYILKTIFYAIEYFLRFHTKLGFFEWIKNYVFNKIILNHNWINSKHKLKELSEKELNMKIYSDSLTPFLLVGYIHSQRQTTMKFCWILNTNFCQNVYINIAPWDLRFQPRTSIFKKLLM